MTPQLKWTKTTQSETLVVYRSTGAYADRYIIRGRGRKYGQKLVRDWELYHGNVKIGTPARLAEAKRDAQYHLDAAEAS